MAESVPLEERSPSRGVVGVDGALSTRLISWSKSLSLGGGARRDERWCLTRGILSEAQVTRHLSHGAIMISSGYRVGVGIEGGS